MSHLKPLSNYTFIDVILLWKYEDTRNLKNDMNSHRRKGGKEKEKLNAPLICFLMKASPISTNKGSEGSRR